jgi:hypothetical protein
VASIDSVVNMSGLPNNDLESFKRKIEQFFQSGEMEIVGAQMTPALRRFELEMWKAESLNYALHYIDEHEQEKRAQLSAAIAKGRQVRFKDFREYQKAVLDAVTVGSLALFWRGFEAYCRLQFGTSRCINTVRERSPGIVAQCHRNHRPEHVLTILKDVRNRELHANGGDYDVIKCDRPPDEITLQPVMVLESRTERFVLLFHDMGVEEQLAWWEKVPTDHRTRNSSTTLGEYLVEEARECVKISDYLSDPTGGLTDKKVPPRKPVRFPLPP